MAKTANIAITQNRKKKEMELKQLIEDRLTQFCEAQPDSKVAEASETEEGFADTQERVQQLLENEFEGQEITIEEVLFWIEANEYEN